MDEVQEADRFVERVAGIDVGKAELEVCVRVPGDTLGRRRQEVRTYPARTRAIVELSDWLRIERVELVVMEATGDYWKPPFYLLEDEFRCWLLDARQVKHLPGRPKTDLRRCDLAGQSRRTRYGHAELRAAQADPPATRSDPLSAGPHPGPHPQQAAAGESAGGCADQAQLSDLGPARRLRSGHGGGADRRTAGPEGTRTACPRFYARQDQRAGRGTDRALRRSPRTDLPDDAVHDRRALGADRAAHRPGRTRARPTRASGHPTR